MKKRALQPACPDPDDIPELSQRDFDRGDVFYGEKLIRRGRPKLSDTKVPVTIRYDADILAAFRAMGAGWQTKMNAALREWLAKHGDQ